MACNNSRAAKPLSLSSIAHLAALAPVGFFMGGINICSVRMASHGVLQRFLYGSLTS